MWQWLVRVFGFRTYALHSSRTVRYTFSITTLTALFVGLAAVTTSNDVSYITITTSQKDVTTGDSFTIEVSAYAHVPVNAVDIVIDYPENQLDIESIDTGTSVITLWTEEPYEKDGKIYLRGGVFQKGFLGEHEIAKIRGRAKESGVAYINLEDASFIAGDGKGTSVSVERVSDTQTKVYVNAEGGELQGEARVSIVTDLDGDGTVDLGDISAFMSAWLTRGKTFDFNGDGKMTFRDFSILLADSFFK